MTQPMRIDIVSDVVCPWCAIGYNQLRVAIEEMGQAVDIHWHPFQLNPDMPPEGQNLREHLMGKYGMSLEQSVANRERIVQAGAEVGFTFAFRDETRSYNTLAAHQLIHWAREEVTTDPAASDQPNSGEAAKSTGREHDMKLALLKAYFTDGRDISNPDVLVELANALGLDGAAARTALEENRYLEQVQQHMAFWRQQGITGVPAVILKSKYLINGAAGVETFKRAIQTANEAA